MIKAAILDLDGTIVDTLTSTYEFFKKLCKDRKKAFRMNGKKINSVEDFRRNWRLSVADNYRAIGYAWPKNKEEIDKLFLEHRLENPPEMIPGMYEIMPFIQEVYGKLLGLVTASPESLTRHAFNYNKIPRNKFRAIVTEDGTLSPKPSPDYLYHCVDIMGVAPQETVYIGDTPADVIMAGAAGATSIAMRWKYGFSSTRALLDTDPDHSAIDAKDLERVLTKLFEASESKTV